MIRLLKILIIVGLIGFAAWGGYNLERQNRQLKIKFNNLKTDSEILEKENQALNEDINYFGYADNLIKMFKSLFNYHQPDEKMMIIIPGNGGR